MKPDYTDLEAWEAFEWIAKWLLIFLMFAVCFGGFIFLIFTGL